MTNTYVMKISRNGQVSIPVEARTRWNAERLMVVDLGDHVVMRPLSKTSLRGKYRGRAPATTEMRQTEREDTTK